MRPSLERTSPETTHARQRPVQERKGSGTYDLFLGQNALVEIFVDVLHVDEERAHAARRETSVAGKPLEGQGGRVHESELLVQVQDVMFQAL